MSTAISPTIAWSEVKGSLPRSWKSREEAAVKATRKAAAHGRARWRRVARSAERGGRGSGSDEDRPGSGSSPSGPVCGEAPRVAATLVGREIPGDVDHQVQRRASTADSVDR